jgi:phosphoribosylanthranilate isomerase
LTNLGDVKAAMAAGADLLGFIFFPKSPRYVTPEQVRDILAGANPAQMGVLTVGVFVNEPPEAVARTLSFCGLDLAQLHGEEPPVALGLEAGPVEALTLEAHTYKAKPAERLAEQAKQSPLRGRAFKALRPRSLKEAATAARRYALPATLQGEGSLPALLLDAYHPARRGGTGQAGDWQLAASLASQYPILLAGGLTPANVAQAVRIVQPWGVDVASGVEEAPGEKNHAAMRGFVAAAKTIQGDKTK